MSNHSIFSVPARSIAPVDACAAPDPARGVYSSFTEMAMRVSTAALLAYFAYNATKQWVAAPDRITLLLLVIAGCMTTTLSLLARAPRQRNASPVALFCSIFGTYGCVAYKLTPGVRLAPETLGALIQVFGILWQIYAKASLRRSFGILPANRGVVSRGAYQYLRHPMYFGYVVADFGFLITNFGIQNVIVYTVQVTLLISRILYEERLLSEDESYRTYRSKVIYRLIPKLF
jgi:protein-S-isoprenylcysteine O-methyltransferase Ste14